MEFDNFIIATEQHMDILSDILLVVKARLLMEMGVPLEVTCSPAIAYYKYMTTI